MQKVYVDISSLDPTFRKAQVTRGTGRYVSMLKEGLQKNNYSNFKIDFFNQVELQKNSLVAKLGGYLPFGKQTFKTQFALPKTLSKLKSDLIHFPTHLDAPSRCKTRYGVTVLDLIPLIFKDLYQADKPGWRFKLARGLENKAIKNADFIIAISECTANDVNTILKIPSNKIFVVPLGVETEKFKVEPNFNKQEYLKELGLPEERPIVLYVGGIDQRKNCIGLLKTFQALLVMNLEPKPLLLMCGRIFEDEQYPKLKQYIDQYKLTNDVIIKGYVPDSELAKIYASADVFCFLSLYEGFGLPILEAFAAKLPVVCSNNSSLPEVARDAAIMVNPSDYQAAAEAVRVVLTDSKTRDSLIQAGIEKVKTFTWDETTDLTIKVYENYL